MPLDFLLDRLNEGRLSHSVRCHIAIALLPYAHHRLSPIGLGGLDLQSQTKLDMSKISNEELDILEKLAAKAEVTEPAAVSTPEN